MSPDWLMAESEGHRLRFIASRFEGEQPLYQQLTRHFGAVQMECAPMALRAIANTLMQQRKRDLKR